MKLENLLRKGRNGIAALGLAGLGSLVAPSLAYSQVKDAPVNVQYIHCTPQPQNNGNEDLGEVLSILGLAIGLEKPNNPDAQKAAALLANLGQMKYQKELAREGRTQINQGGQTATYVPAPGCVWGNPENPNDFSVRKSLGMAFAANRFQDFNMDEVWDLNEFIGIKDRFYDDENILLVLYNPTKERISKKEVKLYLWSPSGEMIHENSWKSKSSGFSLNVRNLLAGHSYGTYTAVWHSDGITDIKRFEILPSPKKENETRGLSTRSLGKALATNIDIIAGNYKDLNNNGNIDLYEITNFVRDSFYDDETITLFLYNEQYEGEIPNWELYDPHGNKIMFEDGVKVERERNVIWGPFLNLAEEDYHDFFMKKGGGYGTYMVVWNLQGITDRAEFELVPYSEREKK